MSPQESAPFPVLIFRRDSHFFLTQAGRLKELEDRRELVPLAADQILHPVVPHFYVVRKGKLRISQFQPSGPEITRAILQGGSIFHTSRAQTDGDKPAADLYILSRIVVMALGETELWAFSDDPLSTGLE